MQKKSLSLQAFRLVSFVFFGLLAFSQLGFAQQGNGQPQNALLQGQMSGFTLLPAPKAVPDVTFLDAAGQQTSLRQFRGKLVLLTLWATWCPYCARELPTLDNLQEAMGKEKFMVLPISVDKEGPEFVKRYLEDKSLNFPTYADPKNMIGKALSANGVPYCILIDQHGREIGRIAGETNWAAPESIALLKSFIR